MLNMKPGELSEWVAADESPVVPTPSNSDSCKAKNRSRHTPLLAPLYNYVA